MSFTNHYINESKINKQPLIDYAKKFKSSEDLLRSGGFPIELLDKVAYGFSSGDIKQLHPKKLNIKWNDLENVEDEVKKSGLSSVAWSKKVDLSEPIEVSYENGKFWIEDGHHRYYAAKMLNKMLRVDLEIKDKPIRKILNMKNYDYDKFHRDIYDLSQHSKG